jgi:hypothetical protein
MFENTITKSTTKKYKRAIDLFNLIQNEKLLDNINFLDKERQIVETTIGDDTFFIQKRYVCGCLEIIVRKDNSEYLRSLKLKKKEFDRLFKVNRVYIYKKDEHKDFIGFKGSYSQKYTEFIHDDLWYKDFKV